MRILEARAWVDTARTIGMYDIHEMHFDEETIIVECIDEHDKERSYETFGFDDVTIEYDTGKKDKNGAKIYEGDIVKHYQKYMLNNDSICKIVFDERNATFKAATPPRHEDGAYLSMSGSENMEVIGNIHQNPELLEQYEN